MNKFYKQEASEYFVRRKCVKKQLCWERKLDFINTQGDYVILNFLIDVIIIAFWKYVDGCEQFKSNLAPIIMNILSL